MKTLLPASFVRFAAILTLFVLTMTGLPSFAEGKPRTAEDAITPVQRNPDRHAQFLQRIKEGDVGLLFLGESISDFWPRVGKESWAKFAPYKPANFAISGEQTESMLWRLLNGELDGIDPKVVILLVGSNNIGHYPEEKPEWAAAGVIKIVDTIHEKLPKTKVLLLGCFPRDGKDSVNQQKVTAINQIISKLENGTNTRYLDITKVFLDADGNLPVSVMPDHLHPNAHGYDLWYEAMNPLLTEMMK